NYAHVAKLLEDSFFQEEVKEEGVEVELELEIEGPVEIDDSEDTDPTAKEGRIKLKLKIAPNSREPKPAILTLDDQGPLIEPCGDPQEAWVLATMGARIHRPSLRKPVLPQRIFMRRRISQPGGAIIIDASGSMALDETDIIKIIDDSPMATLALYDGN